MFSRLPNEQSRKFVRFAKYPYIGFNESQDGCNLWPEPSFVSDSLRLKLWSKKPRQFIQSKHMRRLTERFAQIYGDLNTTMIVV